MIKSLVNIDKTQHSMQEVSVWIQRRNQEVEVSVEQIPFEVMRGWYTDVDGCLHHESGWFFSIEGIHVRTDVGTVQEW